MDWVEGMQRAIDYVEDHITEELDYSTVAAQAYSSSFHFQRAFHILCGYTLGEYIRSRRLTLAGIELLATGHKVLDVALKYGYNSPDSFAKAFTRFHGIPPSSVHKTGVKLNAFSRLSLKLILEGGMTMAYKIETKGAFRLIGIKRRFTGNDEQRFEQERDFWIETRAEQDTLAVLRDTSDNIWHDVNCRFTDDGCYDHFIAVASTMPCPAGFEEIEVPAQTYVMAETQRAKYPTLLLPELRRQIVSGWLPSSGYQLTDGYEISKTHWYPLGTNQKYIECWMPVEKT